MTNVPTRRTLLAFAVLAIATLSFLGGGYTFGLLTDQEETSASFRAASDFGNESPDGDVAFRGCGEVRFEPADRDSFSATVTLYNDSRDVRETVTLNQDDAESEPSGFWFDSDRNRYRFDVHEYYDSTDEEDKVLALRLDGERFDNEHRCADDGSASDSEGSGTSAGATTTTAGNAGSTTPTESGTEGSDENGATSTETAARTTTETTDDDS